MTTARKSLNNTEFVSLLAMMVSILALSIDAMLPALGEISRDLKFDDPNDAQLIVSAMFLGFAAGQLLAGPLSDSFGRKVVIYWGYVIFIGGCLLSVLAGDITLMLLGRVLQGIGAAAPRIVSVALVRDLYQGRAMARIMSIVMAVFILIPAIAPGIGQGVMLVAHWRAIFGLLLAMALIAFIWFAIRQPETHGRNARRRFSLDTIIGGVREAVSYRSLVGYTLAAGLIFGAFLSYLNSAQQVFQDAYATGRWFSVYFGIASLSIGAASIYNSSVVMRLGMRFMATRALLGLTITSGLFIPIVVVCNGMPPFWAFMVWLLIAFFCIGILFGNLNALAMEPVGHMAGLGAAVIGSLSTFISLPLGWFVGAEFDGTVLPLVTGFAVLGGAAMVVMRWTEQGTNPQSS